MTNAADAVDAEATEFLDGEVTLEYDPVGGGEIALTARHDGDVVESANYNVNIFGSTQLRNTFLNSVEESLEARDVDGEAVRRGMKEWFAEMNQLDRDDQTEKIRPRGVNRIIEGTNYPVEIHGGETTTWHVELTLNGRTEEIQFTAAEMTGGGPKVLEEKVARHFFELIKVSQEDWQAITRRWAENTEVASVVKETTEDSIADAVLRNITGSVVPVAAVEDMNDTAAALYDPDQNKLDLTLPDAVALETPVLWVQDDFVCKQLQDVGKSLQYKNQLVKTLNKRGDLLDTIKRTRKLADLPDHRAKVYPFDAAALGVTPEDVAGAADPNHSEVDA